MSYKIKTEVDGRIKKVKTEVCPMALYDPSLEKSEIETWKKPYAVNETGEPLLFGEEKLLSRLEERTGELLVGFHDGTRFKHKKPFWNIFITDYRVIMTLPAKEAPKALLGVGSIKPRLSLTRMAAAAVIHAGKTSKARAGATGQAVFNGFYTNLAIGKIKLDKNNVNHKIEMHFRSPGHPIGKNAHHFPNGTWDTAVSSKVEIQQFSSEDEAIKLLNQIYMNAIATKKSFLELMKTQGRLLPETTENELLNELNNIQADPVYERKKKDILYHNLCLIDSLPFLPTDIGAFGVRESSEDVIKIENKLKNPKRKLVFARK